ncbi:MAG: chorismate mutase [Candidatus Altarchaeaceae archaeon]
MSEYDEKIKNYRNEIDKIDKKIAKLLKERFEKVKFIAELKKKFNKEIEDRERENEIYKNISEILNIDENKAKEIYKGIIDYSKEIEKNILNRDS